MAKEAQADYLGGALDLPRQSMVRGTGLRVVIRVVVSDRKSATVVT